MAGTAHPGCHRQACRRRPGLTAWQVPAPVPAGGWEQACRHATATCSPCTVAGLARCRSGNSSPTCGSRRRSSGPGVRVVADRGYRRRGLDGKLTVTTARGNHRTPQPGDREISVNRCEVERPIGLLKAWAMVRRSRVWWRAHHPITAAVAVLMGLRTYGPRVAGWPACRSS